MQLCGDYKPLLITHTIDVTMYGIFTNIWLMINVGKYTIHGCYGL